MTQRSAHPATEVVIVVGNPRPASRTREAAELLAAALTGGEEAEVIEVSELGPELLGWEGPAVAEAKARTASARLVIFASPTFKATYTGLIKLFLDQFDGQTGLAGVVAVPLMLAASDRHALAADLTLRPVLTELGALALPGLCLNDRTFRDDGAIEQYAARWSGQLARLAQPQRSAETTA